MNLTLFTSQVLTILFIFTAIVTAKVKKKRNFFEHCVRGGKEGGRAVV